MKLLRVGFALLMAAGVVACSKDTTGELAVPDPVAGLRYVNVVPDTGAVDFRVIDVVINAPNQVQATFRTGGSPSGVPNAGFMPPYAPVLAGTRHIRVFMNGTTAGVASQVVMDTTFTFVEGKKYTFFMYGYTNIASANTPKVSALITTDSVPTLAAGKVGIRVLNLAPNLTGNPIGSAATAIDAQVGATTSAVPIPVSAGVPAVAANLAFGQMTAYVPVDVSGAATYRLGATATGTTSPLMFQANMPTGAVGTPIANPIAGTAVAGSAITALIVPRSVAGSPAPQTTATSVSTNIDSIVRSNDTVTVWRRITPGNGTTSCNTAVAVGVSANDVLHVAGLTQPEYNGSHTVIVTTAGTSQTGFSQQTITVSNTSAGATYRLRLGVDSTPPISYDADSTTVRTMLAGLTGVGGNANVGVTGAVGGPYTVTFKGTFANVTVASMTTSTTQALVSAVAVLPVLCTNVATASRFRYRIGGVPVSPATGAGSYKIITAVNDFSAPTVLFLIDQQPLRTAP
jgi:hypothetical protein